MDVNVYMNNIAAFKADTEQYLCMIRKQYDEQYKVELDKYKHKLERGIQALNQANYPDIVNNEAFRILKQRLDHTLNRKHTFQEIIKNDDIDKYVSESRVRHGIVYCAKCGETIIDDVKINTCGHIIHNSCCRDTECPLCKQLKTNSTRDRSKMSKSVSWSDKIIIIN